MLLCLNLNTLRCKNSWRHRRQASGTKSRQMRNQAGDHKLASGTKGHNSHVYILNRSIGLGKNGKKSLKKNKNRKSVKKVSELTIKQYNHALTRPCLDQSEQHCTHSTQIASCVYCTVHNTLHQPGLSWGFGDCYLIFKSEINRSVSLPDSQPVGMTILWRWPPLLWCIIPCAFE